ncbi:MAG: MerR family transcriptional regulator, partial [Flavitalea sp.]
MKKFSISQLENLSGIKAHTIRIWENRFSLLTPNRSAGNTRYYGVGDLKRLMNIAFLNRKGLKISSIASMQEPEIEEKMIVFATDSDRPMMEVNKLVVAMFAGDTEEFEFILDKYLLDYGINATLKEVVIPFLERINLLSYKDTSSEVHFAVNAVRRKIILGIEKPSPLAHSKKTALLFLPEGEHYDLLLLYMNYLLKSEGVKVLYLGTNISIENICKVSDNKKPDFLVVYVTPKKKFEVEELSD